MVAALISSTPDPNDIEINYRSGLFWPETLNRQGAPEPDLVLNRSHSFHTIQDGTGNTLMLTENVNAAGSQHWGDPDPRFAAFVYPVDYVASSFTASTYYAAAPLDNVHSYGVINGGSRRSGRCTAISKLQSSGGSQRGNV